MWGGGGGGGGMFIFIDGPNVFSLCNIPSLHARPYPWFLHQQSNMHRYLQANWDFHDGAQWAMGGLKL